MTSGNVLITGGAGFIGSHVADELLRAGYDVRALDVLDPPVHGEARRRPSYLDGRIELVVGDVRDRATVDRALQGMDAVFHLAAVAGVGESMYDVERYVSVNGVGTAVLMEALMKRQSAGGRRIQRLVVASSMSVYGEGLLDDEIPFEPASRTLAQLTRGEWDIRGREGRYAAPVPTPETKTVSLESIYALTKYDQERTCLLLGRAYGIETVGLRLFNVYGARQALSNPYAGVLTIFASRILNGNRPLVFEDGAQRRDFVDVHDVAVAFRLALEAKAAPDCVFNIGSGTARTIEEVARTIGAALGRPDLTPDITRKYRVGDVRHCFADISRAREVLGYAPKIDLADGVKNLAAWLKGQVARDRVREASAELEARG